MSTYGRLGIRNRLNDTRGKGPHTSREHEAAIGQSVFYIRIISVGIGGVKHDIRAKRFAQGSTPICASSSRHMVDDLINGR